MTACSIDYDINIDDIIEENINISESNMSNVDKSIYNEYMNIDVTFRDKVKSILDIPQSVLSNQHVDIYDAYNKIEGTEYYDTKLIDSNSSYGINLSSKFEIENLEYLKSVKECYSDFKITRELNLVSIITSKENSCFDLYPNLDEINIRITTKYKVVESNSISYENDTYIWNINRNNYNNQSIYIKIDTTPINNEKKDIPLYVTIAIIFGAIFVISGIIYIIIKFVSEKNNKI